MEETQVDWVKTVESIPVGVLITDLDGRIAYLNEGARRIAGITQEQICGEEDYGFLPFLTEELLNRILWYLLKYEGPYSDSGVSFTDLADREVFINLSASLIKGEGGPEPNLVLVFDDVTRHYRVEDTFYGYIDGKRKEAGSLLKKLRRQRRRIERQKEELERICEEKTRMYEEIKRWGLSLEQSLSELRRTQEQLIQSAKLASLGQLIAGVAHEMNNPLMGIIGYSDLLLKSCTDESLRGDLEEIIEAAGRCKEIISNLLTFAQRYGSPKREIANVNRIIETVLQIRDYTLREGNIEVIKEFDQNLPGILVDFNGLQQVFLNIVINAEQAMLEGGKGGRLRVKTALKGEWVQIEFSDTGPGISEENLGKIFDPFYTTREVGEGTGLGLSVCYGIIKEHGGEIHVKSVLGEGTTLIVRLPFRTDADPVGLDKQ